MNNNKWLCVVGGKSGGHIVPGLELARQAKVENSDVKILFISADTPLDMSIVSGSLHVDMHACLRVTDKAGFKNRILALPLLAVACIRSMFMLSKNRPHRVVSMGGMVSVPVCLAAWVLRIPVTLYELNATPGRAISFLARFSQKICICFDSARKFLPPAKVTCVNYPVRFSSQSIVSPQQGRMQLGIPEHARVLLVLGGSQGSRFINVFAQQYARHVAEHKGHESLFILHQAGDNDSPAIQRQYDQLGVQARVFVYAHDIVTYYFAADVVVARAGAGTLFELSFFEKKALVIPLETAATDHQYANADAIVQQYPTLFIALRQRAIESNPLIAYQFLDDMLS